MKKKIEIISILLVIVLVVILAILLTNKKKNEPLDIATEDSGIAFYYQNDSGGYTKQSSNKWGNDYILNVKSSKCNNVNNPANIIKWDSINNTVIMNTTIEANCTLYFDKKKSVFDKCSNKTNLVNCIKSITNTETPDGDGSLMYHTSTLSDSAADNGYRYSGNNPNNFICFGPGSESYNNGKSTTCPDGNLYRIIGYIPVYLSTGTSTSLIKVIKSEYATHDDLGISSEGTPYIRETYTWLKRVKELPKDGFYWNDDAESKNANVWDSSSLYKALNTNSNSFLKNLNSWADKIEEVQWNVGGSYSGELEKPKVVYEEERSTEEGFGASKKVKAKIGLMYPSDYGFASEQKSWKYELFWYDDSAYNYNGENNQNRENNWLYNAVNEWTILRYSDYYAGVFAVYGQGTADSGSNVDSTYSVRPAFYLKSSVTLSGGNGIDGSSNHPYKVS